MPQTNKQPLIESPMLAPLREESDNSDSDASKEAEVEVEGANSNKLFVGGVSWTTTDETFREFFSGFGNVTEAVIMRDRESKSRGFGFVTFSDTNTTRTVLNARGLELDGRRLDCKMAIPKGQAERRKGQKKDGRFRRGASSPTVTNIRTNKIFVGGLSPDTTQEEFQNYFRRFGQMTDALVMTDRDTGRLRGFGFVSFETEDMVEQILAMPEHVIMGKVVDCKKAVPKSEMARYTNGNPNPAAAAAPLQPRAAAETPAATSPLYYGTGPRYEDLMYSPSSVASSSPASSPDAMTYSPPPMTWSSSPEFDGQQMNAPLLYTYALGPPMHRLDYEYAQQYQQYSAGAAAQGAEANAHMSQDGQQQQQLVQVLVDNRLIAANNADLYSYLSSPYYHQAAANYYSLSAAAGAQMMPHAALPNPSGTPTPGATPQQAPAQTRPGQAQATPLSPPSAAAVSAQHAGVGLPAVHQVPYGMANHQVGTYLALPTAELAALHV